MISKKMINIALLSWLMMAMAAYAEDNPLDFNQQMERLKGAKSVTVSMRDPARGEKYEWVKSHPKYSCTYSSQDSTKIAQVTRAFNSAKVRKIPANESFLPLIQIEVYFTLANNVEAQFLFGKEYLSEETVDGEFNVSDEMNAISILANRRLAEDLFNWARQAGKPVISEQRVTDRYSKAKIDAILSEKAYQEYEGWCSSALNTNYYRNRQLTNQTCHISFFNNHPDICSTGWQSTK